MRSFKVGSNPTWLNLDTEIHDKRASQVALVVKNLPANAGDVRDTGSIPESGRSPGEGNGNPLQYSCLENSLGRRSWRTTVHGVAKNQTQLSDWACTHTHTYKIDNSTGNSPQYSVMTYMGKEPKKSGYMYICITDSLCCISETNTML